MQKALFSSPAAALESTKKRIALLQGKSSSTLEEASEVEALRDFEETLTPLATDPTASQFSKYQRLKQHLQSAEFGWEVKNAEDRLVIFSERIETLRWLREHLTADLKLKPNQIELLHGQMADTEQQELVERFGRLDDPLRILLCSDVASEGLNLHYFCHRLVHFDLPWSLMVFQQRNGRVDRYGQKHQPQIVYLFTETVNEKIKGDLRILEILEKKDEQANFNLGDPSAFLNVFDPDKEAEKVADFMAEGLSPEQVEATMDEAVASESDNDGDWLMTLFGGGSATEDATPAPAAGSSLDHIAEPASLFASDFHYAKTALTLLNQGQTLCQWNAEEAERLIALTAPLDLQERLRQLPREAQADNDHYALCADPKRMADAIETARQARAEQDTWPKLHYLWPQHPIVEWLGDRVLTHFGRHRAPLLQSHKLAPGEQAFILMSLIPNRKGQPMLVEWQVASRVGKGAFGLEAFDAFIARAGLKAGGLPNRGHTPELAATTQAMQSALPGAVRAMHAYMLKQQAAFSAELAKRLEGTLADLQRLQGRQIEQLSLDLEKQLETVKRGRFEQRSRDIHRVFDDYRRWVEDTLTTEPQPWIQVLAAVCNPSPTAAVAGA